jgi:haloacetate dehalogenase
MAPVTHHTIHVNGIKIHYVESGEGSPLVLLHGFPETWYCWRHQIPVLAEKFRVIVPDLRGYGETEKPASGYDKRTMANDIRALLQHSEIEKVSMVGHDRGARVATRFAKDHPAMLDRLVVMGNIPTRIIFQRMNAEVARGHSFFIFNNVPDLPEALISGREEYGSATSFPVGAIICSSSRAKKIMEYVLSLEPTRSFNDYRAGPEDVVQDEDDEGVLIECPTLVLWGEEFAIGGTMWNFRSIWTEMAQDPSFLSLPECGHLPHEEKPQEVNAALLQFLKV